MQSDVKLNHLCRPVEHIDITRFDAVPLVEAICILCDKRGSAEP